MDDLVGSNPAPASHSTLEVLWMDSDQERRRRTRINFIEALEADKPNMPDRLLELSEQDDIDFANDTYNNFNEYFPVNIYTGIAKFLRQQWSLPNNN